MLAVRTRLTSLRLLAHLMWGKLKNTYRSFPEVRDTGAWLQTRAGSGRQGGPWSCWLLG